jgi:uncharacterized cupredoxin-like copper-binding protein
MRRILPALVVLAATLGACGGPPDAVHVTIRHSRFGPAVLEARVGQTVSFEIENTDPIDHEFILGDDRIQQIHEEGTEAHHGAKPGEISIPAGQTRTTTYTFTEAGSLVFACHLPGHFAYGMRGTVRIEA